jgi:hypothetical protein
MQVEIIKRKKERKKERNPGFFRTSWFKSRFLSNILERNPVKETQVSFELPGLKLGFFRTSFFKSQFLSNFLGRNGHISIFPKKYNYFLYFLIFISKIIIYE